MNKKSTASYKYHLLLFFDSVYRTLNRPGNKINKFMYDEFFWLRAWKRHFFLNIKL